MKGFKEIKIETETEAKFIFENSEMYCDYVAKWDERSWSEAHTDPWGYENFSTKELVSLEIIKFDINGSDVKWYEKKHKQFEKMLFEELEKQNVL